MEAKFFYPRNYDLKLAITAQSWWYKHDDLDQLAVVIARWTPILMLLLVLSASQGILLYKSGWGYSLQSAEISIIAAFVGRLVNALISKFINRQRPFEVLHFVPLMNHEGGGSFPSNHATGAFALAIGCMNLQGYNLILLLLALLLSLSRVYCGLHFLSDIVAGSIHGVIIAACCLWFVYYV